MLTRADFAYSLPEELIAQHPLKARDQARLLIVERATKRISHDIFSNIGKYLPSKCRLVINDSKVMPVRLIGRKKQGEAKIEVFLLQRLADGYSYRALMRPLRRLKLHDRIVFESSPLEAEVIDREEMIVAFNRKNLNPYLEKLGRMPLPPYIKRPAEKSDKKDYQTVYARKSGSVAAPTAGLHFTQALIKRLKAEGLGFIPVTLHVNYGTFKPVEEEDITRHVIHEEFYSVNPSAWQRIKSAQDSGKKIVAVGTTSCRVLESVAQSGRMAGTSRLFIYPGFSFKMTDMLVTNFHLPFSTLLMLVYAFGGKELMRRAYEEAIKRKYRFYSYGDTMIII